MIQNISYYINLLVLTAVLVILVELIAILKLELRIISKRITSLNFKHLHSTATCFDSLIKLTLNST